MRSTLTRLTVALAVATLPALTGCASTSAPACRAAPTSLDLSAALPAPRPPRTETDKRVDAWEETTRPASSPASAPFADISLLVNGKLVSFSRACRSDTGEGQATAGAHLSRGRPPWTWLRGCDGTHATFYAGMTREPVAGMSIAAIFDLKLPGAKPQKLDDKATFEITQVTRERIAGKFEVDLREVDDGPVVHARGTFDLPRLPDDVSPGP